MFKDLKEKVVSMSEKKGNLNREMETCIFRFLIYILYV